MRINHHYAAGRLKSGERNKTEAKYEQQLELQKKCGHILWYKFEGITLKIAEGVRYTPDFIVMRSDGQIELVDCKGRTTRTTASGERKEAAFTMDDSRAKIRMAAEVFPFIFVITFLSKDGTWAREEF